MSTAPANAETTNKNDLLPLIVDLDRTLIKTDSLIEHFLACLFRSPWRSARALCELRQGRAAFKEAVLKVEALDAEGLLFNEDLIAFLKGEKAKGRALHLVTASDQSVADLVASKIGLFETATGSSDGHNLKGRNKLQHIELRFPDGFSYAGDSKSDLVIWEKATSAVLVGVEPGTRKAVRCPVEFELDRQPTGIRDWVKLFRIHQWSKNLLLFVPLILSHSFTSFSADLSVLIGFLAMGLAASGTYVINDISDIVSDRAHETKRNRPIASGRIDAGMAALVAVAMIGAGLMIMATQSLFAAGALLLYLATTLSYSFGLKRLVLVDVFILGALYTLRVVIGALLAHTPATHWLLLFSFFFFLSLSLAKRHVEIFNAGQKNGPDKPIKGRGYNTSDSPLTLTLGIGTNLFALMVLCLYIAADIYPRELYGHPQLLWGIVILVMMWSSRIWLLSHRGQLDDDPVSFAVRDRISLMMGAMTAILFVASII